MKRIYTITILLSFLLSAFAQYDNSTIRSMADANLEPFYHGVASGDPTSSSVIIWTRVTPEVDGPIDVEWMLSTNLEFTDTVVNGSIVTDADRDYTVKVDVEGLSPGTFYYYEFNALGKKFNCR